MSADPVTVGDLDPDVEVLKCKTSGTKVHIPDATDCHVLAREDFDAVPKPAGVLFDDTPICPACRGDVELHNGGEWHAPVDPAEVSG